MRESAITADSLAKTYPRRGRRPPVQALRGISLAVSPGSIFGLLGPNGAGKSTTVKILATLSRPTSGHATVAGHDVVSDGDAVRAAIGYVSQGSSSDPVLTAEQNLRIAARLRGLRNDAARDRVRSLLDDFDLSDAAHRSVSTFSGGMRRKLDVAAALLHKPAVLFLDEPTTGLDPEARAALWTQIRRLTQTDAITVVLTTHYMDEADQLADHVMLIAEGRAVAEGSPAELKAALHGDAIRVRLVEPDPRQARNALTGIAGLRDITVEASGSEGVLVARTDNAAATIGPTIAALDAAGIRYGQVSAARPSLDDVYLHFVGRSLDRHTPVTDEQGRAA